MLLQVTRDVEHSVRVDEVATAPSAVTFSITEDYLKCFYFFLEIRIGAHKSGICQSKVTFDQDKHEQSPVYPCFMSFPTFYQSSSGGFRPVPAALVRAPLEIC